jgi:hypothetical protein
MAAGQQKLQDLVSALEQEGGDPLRLHVLRRAQQFKRSWVEMAEALIRVREQQAYVAWGYEDFYGYCAQELHIRRATAEKLTASYMALERHAPEVIERRDDVEVPNYDSVDYFARALGVQGQGTEGSGKGRGPQPSDEPSEQTVEELKQAVFEENEPVSVLRRRFDPVLYPKPEGAEELEVLQKTQTTIKKLEKLLGQAEGLSRERVIRAEDALEALRGELEPKIEELREQVRQVREAS